MCLIFEWSMNDKWMAFFFSLIFSLHSHLFYLNKAWKFYYELNSNKRKFLYYIAIYSKEWKNQETRYCWCRACGSATCRELWMTRNEKERGKEPKRLSVVDTVWTDGLPHMNSKTHLCTIFKILCVYLVIKTKHWVFCYTRQGLHVLQAYRSKTSYSNF